MVRGAAGLVTDGALRDSPAIAELAFPSYAGGAHATTSSVLHHPADFGLPSRLRRGHGPAGRRAGR